MKIRGVEQIKRKNPVTGRLEPVQGKYRVHYKDPEREKWRYKVIHARTLTQARQTALAIRADALRRKLGFAEEKKDTSPTFQAIASEYMKHAKVSKRDWATDQGRAKKLTQAFGRKQLNAVTSWDVQQYRIKRRKHVSGATVNRELSLLRRIFNLAIEWGKAEKNPVSSKAHFFKEPQHRIRYLSVEEEAHLMNALDKPRRLHVKAIVTAALHTGMRLGELLRLKWEDVNFAAGFIAVNQTKGGELRDIPLNRILRETLQSLPRLSDFVFGAPWNGKPMKAIKTAFKHALKEAGIENFRFHDLRHTCATRLVRNGVDLVTVKDILGHKDIKMTLRYAHPTPEGKREAMASLAGDATHMLLDKNERKVVSL